MRIRWWGQSCFEISDATGLHIVTDPFGAHSPDLFPEVAADWVTLSRGGEQGLGLVMRGEPQVADKAEVYPLREGRIVGISPGQAASVLRGPSIVFEIELEGLRVAHLGDLSQPLEPIALSALARVDVAIAPIHGAGVPGPEALWEVLRALSPAIILPMSVSRYTYTREAFDALAALLPDPPISPDGALFDPRSLMRAGVRNRLVDLPAPYGAMRAG